MPLYLCVIVESPSLESHKTCRMTAPLSTWKVICVKHTRAFRSIAWLLHKSLHSCSQHCRPLQLHATYHRPVRDSSSLLLAPSCCWPHRILYFLCVQLEWEHAWWVSLASQTLKVHLWKWMLLLFSCYIDCILLLESLSAFTLAQDTSYIPLCHIPFLMSVIYFCRNRTGMSFPASFLLITQQNAQQLPGISDCAHL